MADAPRSAGALFLGGLAVLAVALSACRPGSPPHPNILFIVVDTLRADHMDLYGYARPTTPALSAFAREAIVFEQNQSQSGCTFPSVNSLLTSRHPAAFLGQPRRRMTIPESIPSLPEILRASGYQTLGLSSSPVVRSTPNRVNRFGGFGRGYDLFEDACWGRPGACVNRRATELLAEAREPFFLYLHYMEPHAPYRPPDSFPRAFGSVPGAAAFIRQGNPVPLLDALYRGGPPRDPSAADVEQLRITYDEEVRYFDSLFADLLAFLRARDLVERTLVVLLSDHGEELLDHGHLGHCRDLAFQTVLHTPFLLRVPGVPGGRRISELTENLDVLPTVLDLAGVACEGCAFEGRSLRSLVERGARVHRYAFALQGKVRTLFDGRYKARLDLETGALACFDLVRDPGEQAEGGVPAAVAERLAGVLRAWIARSESPAEALDRARETERQLKAVGYL